MERAEKPPVSQSSPRPGIANLLSLPPLSFLPAPAPLLWNKEKSQLTQLAVNNTPSGEKSSGDSSLRPGQVLRAVVNLNKPRRTGSRLSTSPLPTLPFPDSRESLRGGENVYFLATASLAKHNLLFPWICPERPHNMRRQGPVTGSLSPSPPTSL